MLLFDSIKALVGTPNQVFNSYKQIRMAVYTFSETKQYNGSLYLLTISPAFVALALSLGIKMVYIQTQPHTPRPAPPACRC